MSHWLPEHSGVSWVFKALIEAEAPDGGTTVGSSPNFVDVRTC